MCMNEWRHRTGIDCMWVWLVWSHNHFEARKNTTQCPIYILSAYNNVDRCLIYSAWGGYVCQYSKYEWRCFGYSFVYYMQQFLFIGAQDMQFTPWTYKCLSVCVYVCGLRHRGESKTGFGDRRTPGAPWLNRVCLCLYLMAGETLRLEEGDTKTHTLGDTRWRNRQTGFPFIRS